MLALLDERRDNVITQRTRLVNQLHALLRDLVPGGAPTDLTASVAARLLTSVRPIGPVEAARKELARDLVAEIRDADQRLKALTTQIAATVAEHGSKLLAIDGIGRSSLGGCWDAPATQPESSARRRSPTTPASPRSRSPAPTVLGIACPAAATAN